MEMEKLVAHFYELIATDERINSNHVLLYMTLVSYSIRNNIQNPVSISRQEVMKASKIQATATYHKGMRELNAYGYIRYIPSYHPHLGSIVYFLECENGG